jgi:hypothetical protein
LLYLHNEHGHGVYALIDGRVCILAVIALATAPLQQGRCGYDYGHELSHTLPNCASKVQKKCDFDEKKVKKSPSVKLLPLFSVKKIVHSKATRGRAVANVNNQTV